MGATSSAKGAASRIAITGGIAEGKSTVLAMCAELGYATCSSDEIAREVFQDVTVQARLGELLGLAIPVDRSVLRDAIQGNPQIRREVNRIMHPAISSRMDESSARFFEVPLLIESCRQGDFSQVWVVTCGPELQRARLRARYGPEADVEALLKTQLSTRVKIAFAEAVIRTNQPVEDVFATVKSLVHDVTAE